MTTAREMQERCAKVADERGMHGTAAAIRALPCNESPASLSPDAREALTWLAELDGGLPRAPMPVPGSEECYPGPDVPTRVVHAAVRALNRGPADKPDHGEEVDEQIESLYVALYLARQWLAGVRDSVDDDGERSDFDTMMEIVSTALTSVKSDRGRPRLDTRVSVMTDKPIGAEAIERLYRPWRTGP